MNAGTKGTKRYKYQTVPTGKKVQIGTTPFRGVPFVPTPKQAPDTDTLGQEITHALLVAAMQVCDRHGDDEAARAQMRADCLNTPMHLRADLLAHFQQTNPKHHP